MTLPRLSTLGFVAPSLTSSARQRQKFQAELTFFFRNAFPFSFIDFIVVCCVTVPFLKNSTLLQVKIFKLLYDVSHLTLTLIEYFKPATSTSFPGLFPWGRGCGNISKHF